MALKPTGMPTLRGFTAQPPEASPCGLPLYEALPSCGLRARYLNYYYFFMHALLYSSPLSYLTYLILILSSASALPLSLSSSLFRFLVHNTLVKSRGREYADIEAPVGMEYLYSWRA